MLGMRKYFKAAHAELPNVIATTPGFSDAYYWQYTMRVNRAVVYYGTILVICCVNKLVDYMGDYYLRNIRVLKAKWESETRGLPLPPSKVKLQTRYDEVFNLSTFVIYMQRIRRAKEIEGEVDEWRKRREREESHEAEQEEDGEFGEGGVERQDSDASLTVSQSSSSLASDSEDEAARNAGLLRSTDPVGLNGGLALGQKQKKSLLERIAAPYVSKREIPNKHVLVLKIKNNALLFLYELMLFVNENMLGILRLCTIVTMTIACELRA